MSNTDLMIPNKADVPAYVLDAEAARRANEEAAAGISTGYPARIKLSAKTFALVDGNGDEKSFPASKLFAGPDEQFYMPVVIIRAKAKLSKQFYISAYNPSLDGVQPDCFSLDAERPDASSPSQQSETCASCPQNAFGSGKDQQGNPSKGKACTDNKILAVFIPGFGIHALKVPPASLKNFGLYIKQLSAAGVPLGKVTTLIGFDPTQTFSVLIFKFGGYLPEASIPKVAELSASLEAEEIVGAPGGAFPVPKKEIAAGPSAEELKAQEEAKEKAEAAKVAAAVKAKEAKAKAEEEALAAATPKADDIDLGLGGAPTPTPKVEATPEDSELANLLGL